MQARTNSHALLTLMAAQVGLDPVKESAGSPIPSVKPIELFVEGKIDAFLGFPPEPQELRARHVGHVIVNTAVDRPWSQYFCCMLAGNRELRPKAPGRDQARGARHPEGDRSLRQRAGARRATASSMAASRRATTMPLQTLSENPYDKWREYDAEDTIRFYALRLHEAGFIKSSPQKIIADGTDWRFFERAQTRAEGVKLTTGGYRCR